ncbi:MAG: type II toxin-antitoxin system VapC family toxin [Sphingomonadaceae bacterium]|nr:type II toxin-antitoxin system VapC family toxin [Sphingomonadaceae bacterium]
MYLLDTNACLDFLLLRSPILVKRLAEVFQSCSVSTITVAELRVGNRTSADPVEDDRKLDLFLSALDVEPFDAAAAERYGRMMRDLSLKRTSFDRLIAAHALTLGLVLVTSNTSDFADVPGLKVENWAAKY